MREREGVRKEKKELEWRLRAMIATVVGKGREGVEKRREEKRSEVRGREGREGKERKGEEGNERKGEGRD